MRGVPFIVGIGGTTSPGSSTERALEFAVAAAAAGGARTHVFGGSALAAMPHYRTGAADCDAGRTFLAALREADGVILASPGYHGSISGLVKNAIDYVEETARDDRVYLDGLPVGLIATAYGWQATGSTLTALRSIVHALRGWPTPLGAAVNAGGGLFTNGQCGDAGVVNQLEMVGRQVLDFATMRAASRERLAA